MSASARASHFCMRCGEHLGYEPTYESGFGSGQLMVRGLCEACSAEPPPFARAVAYAVYQDEVRSMLHLLKYDRVRAVAVPLGAMLAQAIEAAASGIAPNERHEMLVIAVPLFPARERERGFNQTILMCAAALGLLRKRRSDLPLTAHHAALVRTRATESQFRLNPEARRANLQGAFAVPQPERVRGKDILLVDDIFTTGSTARECATTLLRAGAASVHVATLSRAQSETSTLWDAASFGATAAMAAQGTQLPLALD
ncbi:MAG: ComF family protein [Acidobacteriaceae bacterium]